MTTYENGSIPAAFRRSIEGGSTLLIAASHNHDGMAAELRARFGFGPRVLRTKGGYRTKAVQTAMLAAGETTVSWRYSRHCAGLAEDIDNQRDYRNINSALFVRICKRWGVRFTVKGEPWHGDSDGIRRRPVAWVYKVSIVVNAKTGARRWYWYEVVQSNGRLRRTWLPAVARYWDTKWPYGGVRTLDQVHAISKALSA